MATYVPNADDLTQPTEDKELVTAAAEFRTLKAKVESNQTRIDTLEGSALQVVAGEYLATAPVDMANFGISNLANATTGDQAVNLAQVAGLIGGASTGLVAVLEEEFVATAGQTVFNLTVFTYLINSNNLAVYVNGLRQDRGVTYVETDIDTVTFLVPLQAGDVVQFFKNEGTTNVADAVLRSDLASAASGKGAEMVGFKQAGTGAVATNVHSKLREFVSVKDFGAVGDGVTDDTSAIQAAIDEARRIHFPAGIYLISAPIRLPTQKIIFGDGINSVIKASSSLAAAAIPVITPGVYSPVLSKPPMLYNSTPIQWWNISNISIDGDNKDVYGLWLHENFYGSIQGVYIFNTGDRPYTNIRGQAVEHLDFVCYGSGAGVVTYDNTNVVFVGGGFERLAADWYFDQRQPNSFSKGGVRLQDVWFESEAGKAPTQGFLRMSGRRNVADIHASLHTAATTERAIELNDTTSSRVIDGVTMGAHACIGGRFVVNNATGSMRITATAGAAYNTVSGWYTVANVTDNGNANTWDVNPSLATPVQHVSRRFQVRTPLSVSATGYVLDADYNGGTPIIRMLGNNNNYIDLTSGNLRLSSNLGQRFVCNNGTVSFSGNSYSFEGASGANGWQKPVYLGSFSLWVDSTGKLRIKSGAPTSDTDGTVVGTQT